MRFPNAPLLEVIFELRWQVEKTATTPVPFGYDPGLAPCATAFSKVMSDAGFKQERIAQAGPSTPHQIVYRYRQKDAFPLVQIGHGIFACNNSTEYEWTEFRKLIESGLRNVLDCYPDTSVTPFVPCHLELRYVDVFNEALLGHLSWQSFITKSTKMQFQPLKYLEDIAAPGKDRATLNLQYELKDSALGRFEIQIANGEAGGIPSILMTSKVIRTKFDEGPPPRSAIADYALKWVDGAHDVTHNFFQEFVDEALMARLRKRGHDVTTTQLQHREISFGEYQSAGAALHWHYDVHSEETDDVAYNNLVATQHALLTPAPLGQTVATPLLGVISGGKSDIDAMPKGIAADWYRLKRLPDRVFNDLVTAATAPQRLQGRASPLSARSLGTFLDLWEAAKLVAAEPVVSVTPKGCVVAEWFQDEANSLAILADANDELIYSLFDNGEPLEDTINKQQIAAFVNTMQARVVNPFEWSDA